MQCFDDDVLIPIKRFEHLAVHIITIQSIRNQKKRVDETVDGKMGWAVECMSGCIITVKMGMKHIRNEERKNCTNNCYLSIHGVVNLGCF